MNFLLDANPCIVYLNGRSLALRQRLDAEGDSNNLVGAKCQFYAQVLPDNVSFARVNFKEEDAIQHTLFWPSGDRRLPSIVSSFTVSPRNGQPNIWIDQRGAQAGSLGNLWDFNKHSFVNFVADKDIYWDFWANDAWHYFTDTKGYEQYDASNFKARSSIDDIWGDYDGPWQ
jgi:hypothetical protein